MIELDDINDIDMLEPMRLKQVEIIYQGLDGIILHELRSDTIMISMNDIDHLKTIYKNKQLDRFQLFDVKQKEVVDALVHEYDQTLQFACYQAVYHKKEPIPINYPQYVHIELLRFEHLQMVKNVYSHVDDSQYIDELIQKQHLWGLFKKDEMVGFIGIHDEGSMGLLEVLPQYQRCGYGAILESYLINYYLDQGWIPYCQVIQGNHASLQLQKKLGLEISSQMSYWLFE